MYASTIGVGSATSRRALSVIVASKTHIVIMIFNTFGSDSESVSFYMVAILEVDDSKYSSRSK